MYECRSFLCWHGGDEASSSRDGKGRWRQGETSVHASQCRPGEPEAERPILDRRMQGHGSLGTVTAFTVYTLRPGCKASHHFVLSEDTREFGFSRPIATSRRAINVSK